MNPTVNNSLVHSVAKSLTSGNQPEVINLVSKVADFCIENENGEVFAGWEKETIELMIAYHLAKGTCIIDMDDSGVHGIVMWYNCDYDDSWEFVTSWTEDKPEGDSIFIAFLFSDSSNTLKKMCATLVWNEPNVLTKRIIGLRYRNGVPTKVDYPNSVFRRVLNLK